MCTAATYKTKDFYFGRNLDYEFSYGEEVVITPRNYVFNLKHKGTMTNHLAIIGVAHVDNNYPLYYDAMNEKGLAMGGLNFVGNAHFRPVSNDPNVDNIATFEFIPWILGQCSTAKEAKALVEKINLTDTPFDERFPVSELHWLIADKDDCYVVESVKDGIHIYDNPVGVLTNNPPFDKQLFSLNNYRGLSPKTPENTFAPGVDLDVYSRGMGAIGLPGDVSSQSRFIKVAYTRMNSKSADTPADSINQFFHILHSVEQQRGLCYMGENKYEITLYSSCCDTARGIYYYTTYTNHQLNGVDMNKEDLNASTLYQYPVIEEESVNIQNA